MALTIQAGYTYLNGDLLTPSKLNRAFTDLKVNMAAKKLLGTTTAGAADEIAYTDPGLALLQAADVAAQRTALQLGADVGAIGNTSLAYAQQADGTSFDFTTGAAITLPANSVWDVFGWCLAWVASPGVVWLQIRDLTGARDLDAGVAAKPSSNDITAGVVGISCASRVTVGGTPINLILRAKAAYCSPFYQINLGHPLGAVPGSRIFATCLKKA